MFSMAESKSDRRWDSPWEKSSDANSFAVLACNSLKAKAISKAKTNPDTNANRIGNQPMAFLS
jgi:hypothetical protein